MELGAFSQIQALSRLLNPDGDSDEEHDRNEEEITHESSSSSNVTPASISTIEKREEVRIADERLMRENSVVFGAGSRRKVVQRSTPKASSSRLSKTSIWDEDELLDAPVTSTLIADDPYGDERETPEHEITFKQFVSAEDAYLGIDFERDPSTACSDAIVVIIQLPKCSSMHDMNLEVTRDCLTLTSNS